MASFWEKLFTFPFLLAVAQGQIHIEGVPDHEVDQVQEAIRLNAVQGQFPYQVRFHLPIDFISLDFSGSLIQVGETQAVLTSALWLSGPGTYFPTLTLTAGELTLNRSSGLEQERRVGGVYVHPNYSTPYLPNAPNARHNLALVFPDVPFQLSPDVQPVPLPPRGRGLPGNFTVTGWSRRVFLDSYGIFVATNDLNYASMPLVERGECQKSWAEYGRILDFWEDSFCVGGANITSCSDEQGDPAVSEEGFLEGISTTIGCPGEGSSRVPRIYTKVSRYLDWIEKTVEDHKNKGR